jgi:chromosome segregation ATPase
MDWLSAWPRTAKVAAALLTVVALVGWSLALQRGSRLADVSQQLTAAEEAGQAQTLRTQELEATLARERQAAGDLATLTERLDTVRTEAVQAEQARLTAERRTKELADGVVAAERRSAELKEQTAVLDRRLKSLQGEVGTADSTLTAESAGSCPTRRSGS